MSYVEMDYETDDFVIAAQKPRNCALRKVKFVDEAEIPERRRKVVYLPVVDYRPVREFQNLLDLQNDMPANLAILITQFIVHNGPESVLAYLKTTHAVSKLQEQFEIGKYPGEEFTTAMGRVFERLAYLWLKESSSESNGFFLDAGSCSRVFNKLNAFGLADFTPDGLYLNMDRDTPTILKLLEYKSNPHPALFGDQFKRMFRFLSEFRGESISFPHINILIDKATGLKAPQLSIAQNASVTLVVPEDRARLQNIDQRIQVIPTSFSSSFLSQVTYATLQDII